RGIPVSVRNRVENQQTTSTAVKDAGSKTQVPIWTTEDSVGAATQVGTVNAARWFSKSGTQASRATGPAITASQPDARNLPGERWKQSSKPTINVRVMIPK